MDRKNCLVVFGGQSSEHDVSCVSAQTVIRAINREKYNVILLGITKEGKWLQVGSIEEIASGGWEKKGKKAILSPDRTDKALFVINENSIEKIKIDVAFPVLHGLYGEDGTIQGLFELADIPYVGCGVLASAVSMDKSYTKLIVDTLGIRQAEYVLYVAGRMTEESIIEEAEKKLKFPMFVKPCNEGSSKGVTKAHNHDELVAGLHAATAHDTRILIEQGIVGRELECAILGGREPKASGVGEVLAAAEFYDFEAKYHNAESKTVISPELPAGKEAEIRSAAEKIFNAVGGYSLSRVDFFLEEGTNEVIFNEINTLPGFTSISMYPMLWKAKGLSIEELVDRIINTAFMRKNY